MSLFSCSPSKFYALAIALLLIPSASVSAAEPVAPDDTYHTCIAWSDLPKQAAAEAEVYDKLLLVLHLSGNFTKIDFT